MSLPRKVLEQGRKADEMLEQLKKGEINEDGSPVSKGEEPVKTATEDPASTAVPAPAAPADGIPGDPPKDDGQGKQSPTPDGGVDWKAEAEALKADNERLGHSFKVLQGKYNHETSRLNDEVQGLRAKVANLETALPEQPGAKPSPALDTPVGQITTEKLTVMREMYGNDLVDLILSAKSEAVAAVKPKLDEISEQSFQVKQEAVFDKIAAAHSDWKQIDGLMTWRNFLKEIDKATGEPRQMSIDRAMRRFDATPIIEQLTMFKRRANTKGSTLETQVVPGDSGRTDAPPQGDDQTYSKREVEQFYRNSVSEIKSGKLSRDDYDRRDALYTKAAMEGRVVG